MLHRAQPLCVKLKLSGTSADCHSRACDASREAVLFCGYKSVLVALGCNGIQQEKYSREVDNFGSTPAIFIMQRMQPVSAAPIEIARGILCTALCGYGTMTQTDSCTATGVRTHVPVV